MADPDLQIKDEGGGGGFFGPQFGLKIGGGRPVFSRIRYCCMWPSFHYSPTAAPFSFFKFSASYCHITFHSLTSYRYH